MEIICFEAGDQVPGSYRYTTKEARKRTKKEKEKKNTSIGIICFEARDRVPGELRYTRR